MGDCCWKGPLGAYPDHGVFKAPEWVFKELNNEEAVSYISEWVHQYGVQLVGGCCGTTPDFIRAVSAFCRRYNASIRSGTSQSPESKSPTLRGSLKRLRDE